MKRTLYVTVCCQAYYSSSIELPEDFEGDFDEAIEYAKDHLDDIPLNYLEYIPNSDELDVNNCELS